MVYRYNQFSQTNPYGSLSPLAVAASDRRARALGAAQADAGRATAALTQAGGNPFAAAREAQRGYVAQAGNVNTQASQEMAQIAAQATQQRLAEEERKRQEAEQWIGRGLSAAGSVLGNVLVPGIGGALGGGAGNALGAVVSGDFGGLGRHSNEGRAMPRSVVYDQEVAQMGPGPAGIPGPLISAPADPMGRQGAAMRPSLRDPQNYLGDVHAQTFGYQQRPPAAYRMGPPMFRFR